MADTSHSSNQDEPIRIPPDGLQLTRPEYVSPVVWQLFVAAAAGDLNDLQTIVDGHPDALHTEVWYEFPLHYAVRAGQLEAVELLLELGTNPAHSSFTYSSWPRLLTICDDLQRPEIRTVLESEMRRQFNYDPRFAPLWNAIHAGDDVEFERILTTEPNLIHAGDGHGNRALHWAVLARRISMIERLLQLGADPGVLRADLQSPLHLSVEGDYWFRKTGLRNPDTLPAEVTQVLLENGAEQEFCVAAALGDIDFLKHRLSDKPELAGRLNASRRSPLAHAARGGHEDVVRLLLQFGARPNQPEECAPSGAALFHASARCDVSIMKLLLKHQADPNAEFDSCGNCLSIVGTSQKADEARSLLKDAGAMPGLWEYDSQKKVRERLTDPKPFSPTADLWSSLLNTILKLDDLKLLQTFVDRCGDDWIRSMNPTNGWRLPQSDAMLRRLLKLGMDINATDWFGASMLHHFLADKDNVRLRWLLLHDIDLNAIELKSGTTALGIATRNGNDDAVKLLLQHGARTDLPTRDPQLQPIRLAERGGLTHVAELLQS